MKNLSPVQACLIWTELEQAYYGVNRFGSDTAELYAYRFMPYSPLVHNGNPPSDDLVRRSNPTSIRFQEEQKLELQAAHALFELLQLFREKRECKIFVNGRLLGRWLTRERFGHRVHVKVVRSEKMR